MQIISAAKFAARAARSRSPLQGGFGFGFGFGLERALFSTSSSSSSSRVEVPAVGAWGDLAQCSRAVRVGNHVHVAGTCCPGDSPREQMVAIFDVIENALKDAGASLDDVVITRMFASDIENDWQELGAAHAEIFAKTEKKPKPACTLVGGNLLLPWMKVEVECTAVIADE